MILYGNLLKIIKFHTVNSMMRDILHLEIRKILKRINTYMIKKLILISEHPKQIVKFREFVDKNDS